MEIATAAKDFKQELTRRKNPTLDDKKASRAATFTIALGMKLEDKALNEGIVPGQLEVSGFGESFPDGAYVIFVCKIGKNLQAFAANDTKIVKSTTTVFVDPVKFVDGKEQGTRRFVKVSGPIPLVIHLRRGDRTLLIDFFERS